MSVCVFSDVHGNLPAFERMLSAEKGVDAYLCLGDLVNYGPWGDECVQLAATLNNLTVLEGNHEADFLNGAYSGSNEVAAAFFKHCFPRFTCFKQIAGLADHAQLGPFFCCHTLGGRNIYPDTEVTLDRNFLIGHSHHQFALVRDGYTLVNPGSVGQNRACLSRIDYCVVNTASGGVVMRQLAYDASAVISEMAAQRYPEICLNYYQSKLR